MYELILNTQKKISYWMEKYSNPCLLFSGGKDSMVMLHLMRKMEYVLPVVCWKEPWMPWKNQFINEIIQKWELEAYDYPPASINFYEGNGRIDVAQSYLVQENYIVLGRGLEPIEKGLPYLCGRETWLKKPLGSMQFPWDCAFHGHKSADNDPTLGKVPLKVDELTVKNSTTIVYPLRDWTDEDIFNYIEDYRVPYDDNRYYKDEDGTWKNVQNKNNNPDYYHTCFECCKRGGPDFVKCPKSGLEINNISDSVPYVNLNFQYCSIGD